VKKVSEAKTVVVSDSKSSVDAETPEEALEDAQEVAVAATRVNQVIIIITSLHSFISFIFIVQRKWYALIRHSLNWKLKFKRK
jgi:hypothetical protein